MTEHRWYSDHSECGDFCMAPPLDPLSPAHTGQAACPCPACVRRRDTDRKGSTRMTTVRISLRNTPEGSDRMECQACGATVRAGSVISHESRYHDGAQTCWPVTAGGEIVA